MDNPIMRGEHEEFVKRMEEEHVRQNKRIALLEESVQQYRSLAISVEKMAMNMERMLEEQKKQGDKLEELERVPAKNWNTVKASILSAIGGAIGTGIIAAILNYL